MFSVDELITINVYVGTSAQTVPYVVYDEANGSFDTGNMAEIGSTGIYTQDFTPDAAGYWTFACSVVALGFRYGAMYPVEVGDIDQLLNDWEDGGRLDLILDGRAPAGEYDTELDANMSTRAPSGEYDTEMAYITAAVALASVLGALDDAAAQDGDATDKTVQSLVKGLHDVLWDADGIAAFPEPAAPANGVSFAEVLHAIYDDTDILQSEWADGGRLDNLIDALAPASEYDTQLDANMSTRAPASEYDTEMGYLTELVATEAKQDTMDTNVDSVLEDTAAMQPRLANFVNKTTFWSAIDDVVTADASAVDTPLPDIVVPDLGTLVRAYLVFTCAKIVDTSGSPNAVNVAQNIRIKTDAGAWGADDIAAIAVPDNALYTAADETRPGVCWIGSIELSSEVATMNDTYEVRWEDMDVDGASLTLYDVQVGLIVEWY